MDIDGLAKSHEQSALHISPRAFNLSTSAPPTSISPTTRELSDFVFSAIPPTEQDLSPPTNTGIQTHKRSSTDARDITDLTILRPSPPGRKRSQSKSDTALRMSSSKDYPRRRALQACQICRARKTKCDNERPSCGSCEALGVECNYNEAPASKFIQSLNKLM
jgi:hypothetical protein